MKAQSQAGMIRKLLAQRVSPETIVKRVKKARGGKPTVAYVNWIGRTSKRSSKKRVH